jgi:hypothetical protein
MHLLPLMYLVFGLQLVSGFVPTMIGPLGMHQPLTWPDGQDGACFSQCRGILGRPTPHR